MICETFKKRSDFVTCLASAVLNISIYSCSKEIWARTDGRQEYIVRSLYQQHFNVALCAVHSRPLMKALPWYELHLSSCWNLWLGFHLSISVTIWASYLCPEISNTFTIGRIRMQEDPFSGYKYIRDSVYVCIYIYTIYL